MVKVITFSGKEFAINIDKNGVIVENHDFITLYRETAHLVYTIVHRSYKFKVPLYEDQDMTQEVNMAFIEALIEYDPKRGASFSTFMYLKANSRIKDIYRSKIKLPLIQKYLMEVEKAERDDTEEEEEEGSNKVSANKTRSIGQVKRWREAATNARNLLTASYMSEHTYAHNDTEGTHGFGGDHYDLTNSLRHSCTLELDDIFHTSEGFDED